ncbi:MAG: acyl-CoA synthetase (AMP-forming)/AMP-acid ligase II [Paraglaciecola sp.]|jgi:acyl-CoA synthetase (AMP-forming)/AMP-acid ligase II
MVSTFLAQLDKRANTANIIMQNQVVGAEEVIEKIAAIRRQTLHLYAQQVAVRYTNLTDFVTALVAFDGWCEALYLCPADGIGELDSGIYSWPEPYVEQETGDKTRLFNTEQKQAMGKGYSLIATRWYLASSGTTGAPKWFSHSFASLTRGVKHSPRMQSLRWGSLYQPYRFAGLQVLLQALLSGASIVEPWSEDLLTKMQQYALCEVSAISATPSMWRQLLRTHMLNHLPLINITLGGEIADQALLDILHLTFPQGRIRHIYASTEAGVGFVVADNYAGFPACWLTQGIPGAALMIDDNQHLRIKSSTHIDPTLAHRIDVNGYLDTQDRIQISGDRVLFMGRASGVINVGGNNIHPEKVETVILQVPQVQHVRVFGKNNSVMGALVMADVVVNDDADWATVVANIRQQCKTQLQHFEIPVKFYQQEKIDMSPSGKLTRINENG